MRHDHILQTIGRTPAVRLQRLAPPHVELHAKLESFNPMGSVKDRMALAVIEDARARGWLKPGQTVVEASSGNTGIGLAMVCARLGHPLVIVMAENFSVERRKLMRFLGARVVLTPAALKGSGMVAKAEELARTHGWFMVRQFVNEANARAHEHSTAQEILADFADAPLTHWVTGAGTGGTLRGVARALRSASPGTQIVVCEPDNAPVLASGHLPPADSPESHPDFRPHLMQGWTPDFVPHHTRQAIADGLIDRVQPVSGARALAVARELARTEGILAGTSGGAALAGALELAATLPAGSRLLVMLPDTGERYLSTPLFADIDADMDAEEWAVSRSTPSARFEPAAPAPAPAPAAPAIAAAVPAAAARLIDEQVSDPDTPVVMYALQWCEFCWSLRRLFQRIGVPLHAIDLDHPDLQADGQARALRAALKARTGQPTIPQVFVGGEWIGGCTDTLQAFDDGSLPARLRALGLSPAVPAGFGAMTLLPDWLHKRAA